MSVVGADLDQMRALARTLTQAADRLEAAAATVTGQLSSLGWSGPDAERYRSQWHGESRTVIRHVVTALREAAQTVERNAAEQQQASSATGMSLAGVSNGSPIGVLPNGFGAEPLNPLVGIRDFLGSNAIWPITWGTLLGPLDDLGALPLLDALGLASDSSLSPEEKMIQAGNSLTDLAGGLMKGSVGYLPGLAVTQWGDVAANIARADFSASGIQTTVDYMFSNPGSAFDAAKDAVIGYVPKLFSNVLPW
ncbi:WXG100 family type VII secretion target [Mycobacterium hubeiense]|uniref:WXG100 family type VII secretion target n=1 Tax=Mycobacterium hubeiense TaxID=1867256 RepID=UPI000C7EC136|nr:hypothetical protein [Mycobacterium sp. QGD 101]